MELLSTLEESEAVRDGEYLRYANGEVAYRYTLGKGNAANVTFGELGFSSDLPESFIDPYAIAPYGEISGGRQYDALYIGYSGAPILEAGRVQDEDYRILRKPHGYRDRGKRARRHTLRSLRNNFSESR